MHTHRMSNLIDISDRYLIISWWRLFRIRWRNSSSIRYILNLFMKHICIICGKDGFYNRRKERHSFAYRCHSFFISLLYSLLSLLHTHTHSLFYTHSLSLSLSRCAKTSRGVDEKSKDEGIKRSSILSCFIPIKSLSRVLIMESAS